MVESTQPNYDVSFELKKHFTPQEITGESKFPRIIDLISLELQHAFKCYDTDKNGTMDMKEFKQVLKDLGKRDVTEEQVAKMMAEHDQNKDSVLAWSEFLEVKKRLEHNNMDIDVQAAQIAECRTVFEGYDN